MSVTEHPPAGEVARFEDADDRRVDLVAILPDKRDCANDDVEVLVVSTSASVRNSFSENEDISVLTPSDRIGDRDHTGRMLLIDQDTVLHSVLSDEELPGLRQETAYWSAGSGFASTLIAMMERNIDEQKG